MLMTRVRLFSMNGLLGSGSADDNCGEEKAAAIETTPAKDEPCGSGTLAATKTSQNETGKPQQSLKAKISRKVSTDEAAPAAANAAGSTGRSGARRPKHDLLV